MHKTRLMPQHVCICDRCGHLLSADDCERVAIDFTAGYASVIGDGN